MVKRMIQRQIIRSAPLWPFGLLITNLDGESLKLNTVGGLQIIMLKDFLDLLSAVGVVDPLQNSAAVSYMDATLAFRSVNTMAGGKPKPGHDYEGFQMVLQKLEGMCILSASFSP